MTKLAKLKSRKPPAIIYFLRVAWAASYSEFLLWMVGRRVWCNIGRFSASWPKLDRERRLGGSSLSNGCCDRPSVGRCIGGRLPTISSSESWEYRPGSGVMSRDSASSMLFEATMPFGWVCFGSWPLGWIRRGLSLSLEILDDGVVGCPGCAR